MTITDRLRNLSEIELLDNVFKSKSYRQVLKNLHIKSDNNARNTQILKDKIKEFNIDISHFRQHKIMSEEKKERIRLAVKNNISIAGALKELGMYSHAGNNYNLIKKWVKVLCLDTKHWKGQSWSKNKTHNHARKISLKEIMVKDSLYLSTDNLKKRLIKEEILKNKCKICGLENLWNNKTIVLQLDHINGVGNDNRIKNLRLLCPNCHSQTKTFAGRNIGKIKSGK